MKCFSRFFSTAVVALLCCSHSLAGYAKENIYFVVLFNRNYVVGASSMRSGLFYSTDDGNSWQHTGWNNVRAFGAAVDSNRIFLATGNGIHRTTDGGKFWKITTDWHVTEAMRVAIDPATPSTIYTATAYGIFKSTDNGDNWLEKNAGLQSTYTSSLVADGTAPHKMFAGTEEGLYVSFDGTEHWQRCDGSMFKGKAVLDIGQSRSNPDVLMTATEKDGVWRSNDGGVHWISAKGGLPNAPWYSVAIDPSDANVAYAAGFETGVWKTTDGGVHWMNASGSQLERKSFHAVAVSKEHPNEIFAGEYDGGVWRSQDGGASWKFIGLEGSQVWQIVTVNSE